MAKSEVFFTDFRTSVPLTEKLKRLCRRAGMETINMDGKFDILDVIEFKKWQTGYSSSINFDAADVNKDYALNNADADLMMNVIVGKATF